MIIFKENSFLCAYSYVSNFFVFVGVAEFGAVSTAGQL